MWEISDLAQQRDNLPQQSYDMPQQSTDMPQQSDLTLQSDQSFAPF